jgi:hypothetical protein
MSKNVELNMGALAEPISSQLAAQGLRLKAGQDIALFQKDADAITRCLIRGFIADAAALAARKRLLKNIVAQLEHAS